MKTKWLWIPAAMLVALAARDAHASPGFQPPRQAGGYGHIRELAGAVENWTRMPGFTAFALAVADRESNGNNLAHNQSTSEVGYSCSLWRHNANTRYKNSSYGEADFCIGTGGWFGLMPATALANPEFHNANPQLIFDPNASVVLFADFVRRVKKGFFAKLPSSERTWLAVRRFMSSIAVGLDWQETRQRSLDVKRRFKSDLIARGIDPNFMYRTVSIGSWPGAAVLLQRLNQSPGA